MDRTSHDGGKAGGDAELARLFRLAIESQPPPEEGHIVDDEQLLACWSAGLFTPQDQRQLEHHLSVCSRCRRELLQLIDLGAVVPPKPPTPLRTLLKTSAAVVAALALISALVFVATQAFYRPGGTRDGLEQVDQLLARGKPDEAFQGVKAVLGQATDSAAKFQARQLLERAGYALARSSLEKGAFEQVKSVWQDATRHGASSARLTNLRLQAERRLRREIALAQADLLRDYGYEWDGSAPAKALPLFDEATDALRREYQRVVSEYPADAVLRLNFGQFLLTLNDYEAAKGQFQAALQCGGHESVAQLGLGLAAFERADFRQALSHFNVVLQADSRSVAGRANAAACLKQLGRVDEADSRWRDAAQLARDDDLRNQILAQMQNQDAHQGQGQVPVQHQHQEQEPDQGQNQGLPRRFALLIGINVYADSRLRQLSTCANDAREMARVLQQYCHVSDTTLLTDGQATLSAIRDSLDRLVQTTQPGDTVFVYFSGHGTARADGDEGDSRDEYLVPYDGRLDDAATQLQTMLSEDALGHWIQNLDGRQVALILDTCHAGDAPARVRSAASAEDYPAGGSGFLAAELGRLGAVGQSGVAVLASAQPADVAYHRPEGEMGVMTNFLTTLIARGQPPLSLQDAFDQLCDKMTGHAEQQPSGRRQTPVLVGDDADRILLRP